MTATDTDRRVDDVPLSPPDHVRSRGRVNALLLSLLAGLFVLTLVVTAGASYVSSQPVSWNATSSFAVFPRATADAQSEASYYETLSRGQIVTTMAQVVSSQQREPGTELTVQVVPETSLVTLTATADTRQAAEVLATRALRSALTAVEGLQLPFNARVVDGGPGTGEQAQSGAPRLLAIVVLVGLALALAVQQAVSLLLRRRG